MNTLPAFSSRVVASLLVLHCLIAQAAITGPQTAQLLNTRYQDTTTTCAASKPAWYCNGVLLRAEAPVSGQPFWKLDSDAQALGAQGFAYLRRDLGIRTLGAPHGVIFSDRFTAVGDGKALEVLCAYPLTQPLDASRADHGCGLPAISQSPAADVSSCSAAGVTDSSSWLAHFQQSGSQPARQCSFSSLEPAQFDASLKAHKGLSSEWAAKANRLQVKAWDDTQPERIPIQALFYDRKQIGSLLAAQSDQRDYFNATGQWLPVLRLDLDDNTEKVFGFNLQDQLYIGYQVAAAMNKRFKDERTECANQQAAYFCNGVFFRSNAASENFHAWDPSPGSIINNGVSFSYARADINISSVVFNRPYGFTFKEFAAPAGYTPTVRCAYPYDAATSNTPDPCDLRGNCKALGITSVELWLASYATNPGRGCAFTADPEQFQLSIDVRKDVANQGHNEIMIATWPTGIPEQLPLEALFYLTGSTGMPQAQFIQNDYFKQTQRFLPLMKMDLQAPEGVAFSFDLAEQNAPGTTASRSLGPSGESSDSLEPSD